MLRKTVAIATFVLLPGFCSASTYHCVVKRRNAKAAGSKEVWSGNIVLKDEEAADGVVFIVDKTGTAIFFADIKKNAGDAAAVRAAVKPYDGALVVGLRQSGLHLDLNLGHVDSTNEKDLGPIDADAMSSVETPEIGISDAQLGLSVVCRLQ